MIKKILKGIFSTLIVFLFTINTVNSTPTFNMYLSDTWTWAGGTTTDMDIWDDYGTTKAEISNWDYSEGGDDADALCIDYDVADYNGFDVCHYDGTTTECNGISDFDNGCSNSCISDYTGGDVTVTGSLDTTSDTMYIKTFYNCDGTYDWSQRSSGYYVFNGRRTNCASSGSNTFYLDARYASDNNWYTFLTKTCSDVHGSSYWGCATWDEDEDYTAAGAMDEDPCKIKDGSTSSYACNNNNDCISQYCAGAGIQYEYVCGTDGTVSTPRYGRAHANTCGGQGYPSGDWIYSEYHACTEAELGGSGYVCDDNHDEIESYYPSSPCRKAVGESCVSATDCWNDDGGNICSSINKCTDKANGRDCGIDSDCTSGRCDSTCMAKLANGQACNENSDCVNSNCISGYCGGPLAQLCDGTIEVNAEDNSGFGINGLNVYLNGNYDGSTSQIGQRVISLNDVDCDSNQEILTKCSDNSTSCGTKYTQIDFSGDSDSLNFDCTKCTTDNDLYISQADIYVNVNTNNVKATVHSNGITSNVLVVAYRQDNNGVIKEALQDTISINSGSEKNASFTFEDLNSEDYIHIYVDSNNAIKNEDETNNYIFRAALKPIKAFVNVNVDPSFSVLNGVIKDYITSFIDEVPNAADADVIIMVGHPLISKSEPFTLGKDKILGNGGVITKPYGGIVKSGPYFENQYSLSNKPYVLAYGNRIEGDLAAVKRMINARNIFLDKEAYDDYHESYIDDYDTLGISVMDLMHNNESGTYFSQNNDGLREVAEKILFDNNFEVSVKPVKTLNTTSYGQSTILRVKHVNSDFSEDYKDTIGTGTDPVVFSGGIFSNLETWEGETSTFGFNKRRVGLAKQMSDEGWDIWEIEMTGGPYTDCAGFDTDTCPDYTYDDLVDYYWPASIAGIQEYSGKNTIDYVGHSNGCRAALSSLNEYSSTGKNSAGYYFDYQTGQYAYSDLSVNPVDTFVGVACPATLNGSSRGTRQARENRLLSSELLGNYAIRKLNESGYIHISRDQYGHIVDPLLYGLLFDPEPKISLNLMSFYNSLAINENSNFDLSSLFLNKVYFIAGSDLPIFNPGTNDGEDAVVPLDDLIFLNSSVNRNQGDLQIFPYHHSNVKEASDVKNYIKGVLE